MPTAIEYAVVAHQHEQNGCGGGPPAQNLTHTAVTLAGSVTHVDVVPAAPVEGWLVTGLPAVLLVAVAGLVWHRRKNHLR
ncbi:hypothetical protein [Amycolatopsis vancoresmycina]|uniref:hypothetical protein n=1 Tax=Amycolatopsis vancoresmycina TaxID=208444 RepID=UPI000526DF8C|nr:hypothetical protein [Amycolatopsis vancoresmycina]